ncbi:hypothetical protein BH10PSE8_BH10PSE8_16790 [soil metagenome]
MLPSIAPVVVLTHGPADLPCASCLFDLAEASGMAGAGVCPLKGALLRRGAGAKPVGQASCDAFTPGFSEAERDPIFAIDADNVGARLS